MTDINVSQESLKKLMDESSKISRLRNNLSNMSDEIKKDSEDIFSAVIELFKPHWEAESTSYNLKMNGFYEIQDKHHFISIWSISEVDDINDIFGYVEAVEYLGHTEIIGKEVTFFELWSTAERLINQSGNFDHIFIESFVKDDNDIVHRLVTGS